MSRQKAILSDQGGTSESASPSANSGVRSRRQQRERLPSAVLKELWAIWRADPRVPSINSRRSWAISRNANPRLVDGWFTRRKTCAKKAGQPTSHESYDLPLDPLIVPKRELSTTPIEPELGSTFDLPSDDTLVLVYPPYADELNDLEASSDTVFEDTPVEPKRTETLAYKEVHEQSWTEHQQSRPEPRPSSDEDTPLFKYLSLPVCNQCQGKQSDFTCILCSTKPVQDEAVSDIDATARGSMFFSCPPRLDFDPKTLSELSAIPFLFRTPLAVLPNNSINHRTVGNWTTVEDELGRLVNDGKLDFSFLDVPHLASMELIA